jgi:hypothetical protein
MTVGERIVGFIDLAIETLFLPLAPLMGTADRYPQSPHAQKLLKEWKEEWESSRK